MASFDTSGEAGRDGEKEERQEETTKNQLGPEEAKDLAKKLGEILGGEVFSGADFEKYCATNFSDPRKGVAEAEGWKKKTLADREAKENKRALTKKT